MSWFQHIMQNPYVDVALLVDGAGRLLATSNRIGSRAEHVASMIRAAEVLAQGLTTELGQGQLRNLQLSTTLGHLLVMPIGAEHYLIVLTDKNAPLGLVYIDMQRIIDEIDSEDTELSEALRAIRPIEEPPSALDELDVDDLINAVSEWLQNGGDSFESDA